MYVGEGKGADALEKFWRRIRRKGIIIKHVATDLSAAFTLSVLKNCPHAVHVFVHFHVVKLMNDKLDEKRRLQYAMEKDINKRGVLKGTRYLLLRNGKDNFDKQFKTRGILAWYDCHLSTGKVEGINNKIKVMKRNAYGFRDEKYFKLRLYALHDCRITQNVG